MAEATTTDIGPEPAPARSSADGDLTPVLLAGLLGGAGVIHLAMVPAHIGGGSWVDPVGFAVAGWTQVALAVALVLRRGGRTVLWAALATNVVLLGLWGWARTAGLPVGGHAGSADPVGAVDGIAAALGAAGALLALVLLAAGERLHLGRIVPAVGAVAVLGLSTVAITSPDAAGHAHGGADHHGDVTAAGSGGHGHGTADGATLARMADLDGRRCDLGFNPRSYWADAAAMGVDTHDGGAMAHAGSDGPVELAAGDPYGGRGSAGLDRLIAATSGAMTGGEVAAAGLVEALADVPAEDARAWVRWMGSTAGGGGGGGHGHGEGSGSAAAPDDNGGHGGHAGPQPWVAMVDTAQCVRLAEELQLARDTALAYPTAADATAAGWVRVTPYVPGIAAHYMKYSLVDGTFAIDQPEMLLYDGNGPEARIVGLSYYLLHEGDAEPSQGFTGPNDHFHRHVGLCTRPGGGVIGDSTMTAEECAAIGGRKADGSKGWMSHAWVVPGCESPWGVFSGASPLLDSSLATASGEGRGGPGCAAASVRDRYDLRPGERTPTGTGETAGG